MMKTLTTILMLLAILVGLVLAITPFVADKFFPVPENAVRQAKPAAAAMALKRWFNDPQAEFLSVQAINKKTDDSNNSWFAFSVGQSAVEKYIMAKKLKQTTLNQALLETVFFSNQPPATWWQPAAINQQTYFTGQDQGRTVSIIYNPSSKRGVLVTTAIQPASASTIAPTKVNGN